MAASTACGICATVTMSRKVHNGILFTLTGPISYIARDKETASERSDREIRLTITKPPFQLVNDREAAKRNRWLCFVHQSRPNG